MGTFCDAFIRKISDGPAGFGRPKDPSLFIAFALSERYADDLLMTMPHIFAKVTAEDVTNGVVLGSLFGNKPGPEVCNDTKRSVGIMSGSYDYWLWSAEITPEGVAAGLPKNGGALVIATKTFMGVTGMTTNADESRTAEFKWRWASTTLAKKLSHKGYAGVDVDRPGRADFKLYDDGWRIVNILTNEGS